MLIPFEALLGGLTGLVSSLATGYMNIKMKKLDMEQKKLDQNHELARIDAESKAMILEKEQEIKIINTEYEGKESIEDAQIYKEGQKLIFKNQNRIYNTVDKLIDSTGSFSFVFKFLGGILAFFLGIIEIFQKSIRPGLTIFYTLSSVYICYTCINLIGQNDDILVAISSMDQASKSIILERAYSIINQFISAIIYLTISVVTFWFSDRASGKFIQNHLKGISIK